MSFLAMRLVLRQIRHEWMGAACLCIAMGAAIIPLLMILGLKEGTVTTLRQRLASDPVNLEVRMTQTTRITPEEVKQIQALPGVGFCVPGTRALAASVVLIPQASPDVRQESYLVASAAGDPLLARFGCPFPGEGEIVISSAVAEKSGLTVGATVEVEASCRAQGRLIRSRQACRVIGVLPEESNAEMQSYVPLSMVIGVEEFIEGLRSGINADADGIIPQPIYHGIWLDKPGIISSMRAGMWALSCPFREQREPTTPELTAGIAQAGSSLYFNTAQFMQIDKLRRVYSLAKQHGATLLLWNPGLQATMASIAPNREFLIQAQPEALSYGNATDMEYTARCADETLVGEHIIQLAGGGSSAPIQIIHDATIPDGELRVSSRLLGVLHQIVYRNLGWDAKHKRFGVSNRSFSRVRLYAPQLDEVETLVNGMEGLGYQVSGNIAAIRRVQNLNSHLEVLFGLIACIGVAGAACSLALNLFNSALKRRREYAILCTLGVPRHVLFLFPVYEAIILTLCSLGLSFGAFHFMSSMIARLFAAEIGGGESLCFLSPELHQLIVAIGLSIGLCAALCAAVTVLKVQPSTAIREV